MNSNATLVALGYGEKKMCCALVRIPWARVAHGDELLEEMLARKAVPRSMVPAL